MPSLSAELRNLLTAQGASLVGFADLTGLCTDPALPRAVSIARAVDADIVKDLTNGPTLPYFEAYQRINHTLNALGKSAESFLVSKGFSARAFAATVDKLTPEIMRNPLPHKTAATRAGLGSIGKCALLITKKYGPAVRLNTVMTNAPLESGQPADKSFCGKCVDCVSACPARAVKGPNWEKGVPREQIFDAEACKTTARTLARKVGIEKTICGICIAACPFTQKYIRREKNG